MKSAHGNFAMGGFHVNRYFVLCFALSVAVRHVFVLLFSLAVYFSIELDNGIIACSVAADENKKGSLKQFDAASRSHVCFIYGKIIVLSVQPYSCPRM